MGRRLRAAVIAEGGGGKGFGHVTRCSALADGLAEAGLAPDFIVAGDPGLAVAAGKRKLCLLDWTRKPEALLRRIAGYDAAIVDSYVAPRELYARIRAQVRQALYLDDNLRLDYPDGIILNGAVYADALPYAPRPALLLGPRYIPLRKVFWTAPGPRVRARVQDVLVAAGGEDPQGLLPIMLSALDSVLPCRKHLVHGRRAAGRHGGDKSLRFYERLSASGMKALMRRVDFAVTAGGQTLYELARLGVPAVAVVAADNQQRNVDGWEQEGFIINAGKWDDSGLMQAIANACRTMMDPRLRRRMSTAGRRRIDGQGVRRIVSSLQASLR